jgi:hypothetical protein
MTRQESITILKQFNNWRRGLDTEEPDSNLVGIAIDKAIDLIIKKHHHSSITLEQESELFNHYLKNGESIKYYSHKYKISTTNVNRIINENLKKKGSRIVLPPFQKKQ